MFPQERFLALEPGEDQIVVASVIPSQDDSTSTYISMLVFAQEEERATASVERYTPQPLRKTRRDFYTESLRYYDTVFPLWITSDSTTPASQWFMFGLERTKLRWNAGSGSGSYNLNVKFEEQSPFQTLQPRTGYRIGGLEPIDAEINKIWDANDNRMNGEKIRKPAVLVYHTLENVDLLLASLNKTHYWIDFHTFDGTTATVFFAKDANGITEVIYSTLPAGEQLNAQLYYTVDNSGVLLIGLNSLVSDEKLMIVPADEKPLPVYQKDHMVKTVTVMKDNIRIGTGILYQL
jgi:hypothetical protein